MDSLVVRKAVRILLINDKNELLLMYNQNFLTQSSGGVRYENFWCTIGGKVEEGESLDEALLRELYEETGLTQDQISIGPSVWVNQVKCVLRGVATLLDEVFVVVIAKTGDVCLDYITEEEKAFVKKLQWFSFDQIKSSVDIIFPVSLCKYLPDILAKKYPLRPLVIHSD